MKRTALARTTTLDRGAPMVRKNELNRRSTLARSPSRPKRRPVSPATPEQKAKVKDLGCLVCSSRPVHPAHLIDRSLAPSAGDDPRAVVPLCFKHHREYDDHLLDLSSYLEPHWRTELAWAIEAVGLFQALQRVTGKHWLPVEDAA